MLPCNKRERCHGFYNFKTTPFFRRTIQIIYAGFWNNTLKQNLNHSVFFWGSGFDCFSWGQNVSQRSWQLFGFAQTPSVFLCGEARLRRVLSLCIVLASCWPNCSLSFEFVTVCLFRRPCPEVVVAGSQHFSKCIWIRMWFRKSLI